MVVHCDAIRCGRLDAYFTCLCELELGAAELFKLCVGVIEILFAYIINAQLLNCASDGAPVPSRLIPSSSPLTAIALHRVCHACTCTEPRWGHPSVTHGTCTPVPVPVAGSQALCQNYCQLPVERIIERAVAIAQPTGVSLAPPGPPASNYLLAAWLIPHSGIRDSARHAHAPGGSVIST